MKKLLFILSFTFLFNATFSQAIKEWGLGAEVIYNVPIKGLGFGIRSHLHITKRWVLAPQFSYFPGFNQIHEFYVGANVHFNFTPETKWGIYGILGPHYDHWINFAQSNFSEAQLSNVTAEMGGGIVRNQGCIRPFFEYRANSKWWESNLRLGVLVYFGACSGKGHEVCPAYTQL